MGNYRECEVGVQFGNAYWKLFKFVINEVSKDMYVVFPIPDVGLKLSIHSPKPPTFPTIHAHWRSHKLGIDEDIDASIFSEKYLQESAMEYLNSFRYYQPSGDEDVMVFPNFLADVSRKEVLGKKERTRIDVGKIMQTICKGTFYQTKARKLPLLIQDMKRKNPYLNFGNDLGICALAENRMIIPLSSKIMIEFDHQTFMEKLRKTGFNSFFSPIERAMETISRVNPNAFQKWLPTSDIGDFFGQTMNDVKQSEPRIVTF